MPSLLFIPDISGFTRFVNEIEVDHSQHIVAELLELIIDNDELGLKVAEVEGDAVLFYSEGEGPDINRILQQCRTTFVKFHEHLKAYDGQRICECGACRSAIDLTLKFIAHPSNFKMLKVKDKAKPYGPDVILAHRLMKNEVKSDEYILWTGSETITGLEDGMRSLGSASSTYDAGEVNYQVVELGGLHQHVKDPPPAPIGPLVSDPVTHTVELSADRITVMAKLLDLAERPKWLRGLKAMDLDDDHLNRAGASHRCVLDSGAITNRTVFRPDSSPDRLLIGESPRKVPLMKAVAMYFLPEDISSGTRLTAEAHAVPAGLPGRLLLPIFRRRMKRVVQDMLHDFKAYVEQDIDGK